MPLINILATLLCLYIAEAKMTIRGYVYIIV